MFLLDVYWVARRDDDIKQDTTPEVSHRAEVILVIDTEAPQTEQVVPPMSFSETLKERLALTYEVTVEEAPRQEQPETESDSEQSSWGRHGTEHLSVIMPSTCSSSGSSEAGSYPVTPADDEKPQYLGGACNKSQQSSRTLSF